MRFHRSLMPHMAVDHLEEFCLFRLEICFVYDNAYDMSNLVLKIY